MPIFIIRRHHIVRVINITVIAAMHVGDFIIVVVLFGPMTASKVLWNLSSLLQEAIEADETHFAGTRYIDKADGTRYLPKRRKDKEHINGE